MGTGAEVGVVAGDGVGDGDGVSVGVVPAAGVPLTALLDPPPPHPASTRTPTSRATAGLQGTERTEVAEPSREEGREEVFIEGQLASRIQSRNSDRL